MLFTHGTVFYYYRILIHINKYNIIGMYINVMDNHYESINKVVHGLLSSYANIFCIELE